MIYSHNDFESNPYLAVDSIAQLLHDGYLTLFLGAGVSAGFGLPEWPRLIAEILGRTSDDDFVRSLPGMSDKDVALLVDPIDDGTSKYVATVHRALYSQTPKELVDLLQRSPLLLSVAALVTGSCRGRIESVVTYNYDDLLE